MRAAPVPSTLTIAGGNLMKLAAQLYGDATQWNRIAAANGLWDFIVTGTVTLVIPPPNKAAGNGGILGV
jgi:nucleoid-associated protein YgaU